MKYRHQHHAGNFADVHKHVLLLEVLASMAQPGTPVRLTDGGGRVVAEVTVPGF